VNKNTRSISSASKSGTPGENATYLKLEKPRILFREGSGAAAAAPVTTTATLADAHTALVDASTMRAA
jgi:hypothetical protein